MLASITLDDGRTVEIDGTWCCGSWCEWSVLTPGVTEDDLEGMDEVIADALDAAALDNRGESHSALTHYYE